jgi:hypothetical protein
MEAKQTTYANPVNYKKRRVNMLNDITLNSMNKDNEIIPVTLQKGRKYTIEDSCKINTDGVAIMLCTIFDNAFGHRYECILECSDVIDLFLYAELSQY